MQNEYRARMVARSAEDLTFQRANPASDLTQDGHSPVIMIGKVTGPGSLSETDVRWAVKGTDLGIMWDNHAGEVMTALGDTFGIWDSPGGGGGDWRSNVLLRSTDTVLSRGMGFSSAVEDVPGHAAEVIPSLKQPEVEQTTIPTGGIAVGSRQYLAYMSVRHWGPAGLWDTNHCSIAYSDDNGETWQLDGPRWDNPGAENGTGRHPFQMIALARREGWVYGYGTINGRDGAAHVARVPEALVLEKEAWEYWDGHKWDSSPNADLRAAEIVPAPVAELSVIFNEHAGRWLMMHLEDLDVVLRSSPEPEGPWSEPQRVLSFGDYPIPYGGFMHPWSSGASVYFTVSLWDSYNVYLARINLGDNGSIVGGNLVRDPSFERFGTGAGSPWTFSGTWDVPNDEPESFAGNQHARLGGASGEHTLSQDVTVRTGQDYDLAAFLLAVGGSVPVRFSVSGAAEQQWDVSATGEWRRTEFQFRAQRSGEVTITIEAATTGENDFLRVDDVTISEATAGR